MRCVDQSLSLASRRAGFEVRGLMTRLIDLIAAWAERSRQRGALSVLDERMLNDIGLDRATLSREEAKLFWRL